MQAETGRRRRGGWAALVRPLPHSPAPLTPLPSPSPPLTQEVVHHLDSQRLGEGRQGGDAGFDLRLVDSGALPAAHHHLVLVDGVGGEEGGVAARRARQLAAVLKRCGRVGRQRRLRGSQGGVGVGQVVRTDGRLGQPEQHAGESGGDVHALQLLCRAGQLHPAVVQRQPAAAQLAVALLQALGAQCELVSQGLYG